MAGMLRAVGPVASAVLVSVVVCGVQAGAAQEPFPPVDSTVYPVVNSVAFSPTGDEIYFAVLYHTFLERRGAVPEGAPVTAMFSVRRVDGRWVEPQLLPFSGRFQDYEPTVSVDGRLMVFNSRRPYPDGRQPELNDLWMSTVDDDGSWSEPVRLAALTTFEHEESYATLSGLGTLVYLRGRPGRDGQTQHDLFQARLEDGEFRATHPHPVSTERWGEGDPWIARDESFLIFTRWDDSIGWDETVDLYISFSHDGGWSEPVALEELNSPAREFGPAVSADGRWLHFKRDAQFERVALSPLLERYRPARSRTP